MSPYTLAPTLSARQTTSPLAARRAKVYLTAGILSIATSLIGCQADSIPSAHAANADTQAAKPATPVRQAKSTPQTPLPASAKLIDKQANLYQVDKLLFRSEQLRAADIPLLKANHIDAILSLRFFDQDEDQELLAHVAEDANVALYNQPLKSWHVTPIEIAQALTKIRSLQAQDKSVLVHCYHGADRTGIIIAMYRVIEQGWSIDDAKREMTQGGFGYHPIWINLPRMLNPVTVAQVRQELAKLQSPVKPVKVA